MSNDELFKALGMFQQGVQQYATSNAVNEASKVFQQLNQSTLDEGKKRQELQQLGNDLALRLTGIGAPASHIQTAFQAINPQSYGSAEQMQLEGALLGQTPQGEQLQKTAGGIIEDRRQEKLNFLKEEYKLKSELMRQDKTGNSKLKTLPTNVIEKIGQIEETHLEGSDILSQLKSDPYLSGPAAARIPLRDIADPAYATFKSQVGRFFDTYRVRVTGAGASPGEIKILRENVPVETDTPNVLRAKMDKMLQIGDKVKKRRLKLYEKAGYQTDALSEMFQSEMPAEAAPNTKVDLINKYRIKK
jgi:hypothetical protein